MNTDSKYRHYTYSLNEFMNEVKSIVGKKIINLYTKTKDETLYMNDDIILGLSEDDFRYKISRLFHIPGVVVVKQTPKNTTLVDKYVYAYILRNEQWTQMTQEQNRFFIMIENGFLDDKCKYM